MDSVDPSASASISTGTPPIAYVVAVWLGMSHDEIVRGLASGTIAAPPGAPPGWVPPGSETASPDAPPSPDEPPLHAPPADGGSGSAPSRASVEAWLLAIDPMLSSERVDKLWQSTGGDDRERGAWWRGYLQRVLGVAADKAAPDTSSLDAAIAAAAGDPAHRATIYSLAGRSGADLADLAKTDAGVRYALDRMDPVALTGNRALAASLDATGELDRFDPNTGERVLGDDFIADRAKLVAWKLRGDAGGDLAIPGDARWTFVDRARTGVDGAPFTLTLEGDEAAAATVAHQVVFGSPAGDAIGGGAASDRLYGGSGDDFIRAGAGSDLVDGGRGADTIAGGRGDDRLFGGAGDDDLDGGAGDDALEGAGGDDTLAGGRGDDTLDGGVGDDTYVFDDGDGRDVIADADGRGRVLFDDSEVSAAGATRRADGSWGTADGHFELRYSASGDATGVLTIRTPPDGSAKADEIRIRHWRNGDLGITLGDGGALAPSDMPGDTPSDMAADTPSDAAPSPAGAEVDAPPSDPALEHGGNAYASVLDAPPDVPVGTPPSTDGSTDAPAAPPDAVAAIGATPPDITDAAHPLDALWSDHDRALAVLSQSFVDGGALASAALAFDGGATPDIPAVLHEGSYSATVDALGGGELATAAALAAGDALATLGEPWSARAHPDVLAPPDTSLAALATRAGGVRPARA